MAASYLWLWDNVNSVWVKAQCDANGKLLISDLDPFTVEQTTPENLRHVPHGYYAVGGTYLPYAVDSAGKLLLSIAALQHLSDIADVNLTGLADGDFIYWDASTSKWKWIAHKDATTGVHGVGAGTVGIQNADKTIVDADGDTKIQTEESADEDKIRMDVKGVEAFLLDDVGVLTLAKQSGCSAYLIANQYVPNDTIICVAWDTELSDVQNELDSSRKPGTATATTASHLIDTTANQFVAADVGKRVWNTTDKTYAVVTVYNSVSDLTIDTDIMANGEGYTLYTGKFTAKAPGFYLFVIAMKFGLASATGRRFNGLFKNGANVLYSPSFVNQSATYAGYAFLEYGILLSANDYVEIKASQDPGGADIYFYANSYISINKLA